MPPLQAAVLAFGKNLTVEGVGKSNVIEVAFRHKDPRVAARAVNLLVDDYKEKHLQLASDPKSSLPGTQLAFAPLVDHILFVVQADVTPLPEVQKALEMLPKEKVIGLVLNRRTGTFLRSPSEQGQA
jgi:hypothetical protein